MARFNYNVIRLAPQHVKNDPQALAAMVEEYDRSLGGKLSDGQCPGHSTQTTGRNSVCLRNGCGGRV